MAETCAGVYGLELAWKTGHQKIIWELDSLLLVNMIKDQLTNQCFAPLLHRITDLLKREWEVSMQHVYREANKCAKLLVSLGHMKMLGVHELTQPPQDLVNLLKADIIGVSIPRKCISV